MTARRIVSRLQVTVSMVLVALLALVAPCGVAHADEENLYWYVDDTGVRDAWEQGITGKGVKTAVLDDMVVADYPGFEGTNMRTALALRSDLESCTVDLVDQGERVLSRQDHSYQAGKTDDIVMNHGTHMAALIVGNGQGYDGEQGILGVAPQAELTTYVVHEGGAGAVGGSSYNCFDTKNSAGVLTSGTIRDAVDSGVRVLSMSYGYDSVGDEEIPGYVYALSHGVVMISARDNLDDIEPGTDDMVGNPSENNYFPGVITVNSIGANGAISSQSDAKDGNVAILAPGDRVAAFGDTSDRQVSVGGGTSSAAAVLNGLLALVMQKWPEATGNQIIQSLVRNTKENTTGEPVLDSEHRRGFGTVDLNKLLSIDPSQYPDINPILETMVLTSERYEETKGMYADHSDWEQYTWQSTEKFPMEIDVPKAADMVGTEYERQKTAWQKVEACRAEGGENCMQYSATNTAPTYEELAAQSDGLKKTLYAQYSTEGHAQAASQEQSQQQAQKQNDTQSSSMGLWIGGGCILLALLIIVIALAVVARKNKSRQSVDSSQTRAVRR